MRICGEKVMTAEQVIDECKSTPKRSEIKRAAEVKNNAWKPISHSVAVETIMGAFDKHDIKVLDASFALNKTGHKMVGGFEVVGDCLPTKNVDGNYQMFVNHANDMSTGMNLNAGLNLFVCTNGMMTGHKLAKHRHTINFDFDKWIVDETLPAFIEQCNAINLSVDKMRSINVDTPTAHRMILEAADLQILPYARAIDVYREWERPTFSSDDFEANTLWALYNNFTYVAQKCDAQRQHRIIEESHDFLLKCVS